MTPRTVSSPASSATPAPSAAAAPPEGPATPDATPEPTTDPHTGPLPPHAPAPRRVRAIDGLRGVAVTAVVAYHLFPTVVPGGYLGVDVFFVISGFVITLSLVHQRRTHGRPRLLRFWVRRAQRLLPALAAMLLVVTACVALVGAPVAGRLREQLLAALTFTGNWYQASVGVPYFDAAEPPLLQHLWSLAVEEQFYLAWPLLLLGLLAVVRRARTRVLVVLAAAAASAGAMAWAYTPGEDPSRLYFGTDTHGFGLLLGAAAALALPLLQAEGCAPGSGRGVRLVRRVATDPLVVVGAALVVLLAFAQLSGGSAAAYRGGIALVAALTALLLLGLAVRPGGPVRAVLATGPLVWLGERSYGIYLWHWPVMLLLGAAFPTASTGVVAALTAYLTLLLAAASWRCVEQPVLRHGYRGATRRVLRAVRRDVPVRGPVLVATLSVLAVGATWSLRAAPSQGEVEGMVHAGQDAIAAAGASLTSGAGEDGEAPSADETPAEPPPPLLADATADEIGAQTVVVGDSVALAAAPALIAELPGVGVDAVVGRQLSEAADLLTALRDSGRLRTYVVVALGTNGDISTRDLAALLDVIGEKRRLVLVTAHGDREWMPAVNEKLLAFVEAHPEVGLARWDQASAEVTDFAADGIHPGEQGGGVFARTVVDALRTLR
ncbi:acyltransferase family protein [Nocardioides zeae]|uniref:Acyltransferase family protein n=1 Tax=Nocardioides imazamoxiresistens TaxID=3231893 RepID=A0ABU3PW71_9ACTN|nr:acyltransferase family protein [Nocardioides zeae]MDT9593485.1 acyltransferase family protein [Nocardioides zeae]